MRLILSVLAFVIGLGGCKENGPQKSIETTSSGKINISVDESFEPVISQQIKVFESSFPEASIIAHYKTEADCLRDLQTDSTRMIIISRGLSNKEQDFYNKKLEYNPAFAPLAFDAIAVVINSEDKDSAFTLSQLKDILSGKSQRQYTVAVDGKGMTSTIRYLIDTLLNGNALGKNVTAAKNSEEVINYIASTTNAIGFVGASWLTVWTDNNKALAGKVKMGLVECKSCDKDVFAKPSQQTILFKQYPLVRGLYYVVKENFAGLGSGFSNFLSLERGQLIFSRAGLVPSKMQFNRRRSQIKDSE